MSGSAKKNEARSSLLPLTALAIVVGFLIIYYGGYGGQIQIAEPREGSIIPKEERVAEQSVVQVERLEAKGEPPEEHHHEEIETSPHHEDEHGAVDTAETLEVEPTITFTLKTMLGEGGFYYVGVGGEIDGVKNPVLHAREGDIVKITVMNGDGVEHDLAIPGLGVHMSGHVKNAGETRSVIFRAEESGEYSYYCTIPGHRESGMEGLLIIEGH